MNLPYLQSQVARLEKEIADAQRHIADETKKEVSKPVQIDSIARSINKNTSASTLDSKNRQIRSCQTDIANIVKKKSDYQKKISDRTQDLMKKKQEVAKEEVRLNKLQQDAQKRERDQIRREQEDFQRKLQSDIAAYRILLNKTMEQTTPLKKIADVIPKNYDFFISHATEDKEDFVRPLAEKLKANGHSVWYDESQLSVGDSLRKKIDEGLSRSRYGIVIFSPSFFKKNWPDYELNGLVAREMDGVKVILPIWHRVTKDDVLQYSPSLADKLALNTAIYSIDDIASELGKLLHLE